VRVALPANYGACYQAPTLLCRNKDATDDMQSGQPLSSIRLKGVNPLFIKFSFPEDLGTPIDQVVKEEKEIQ
jgi:hypothetical protein